MHLESTFSQKSVLVTGGAGFIGSHLVARLIELQARVIVVDNLSTGRKKNLNGLIEHPSLQFIKADAALPASTYLETNIDYLFHLASPASPIDFKSIPQAIYQVNGFGTHYLVRLALEQSARLVFASTSEAYGDPEIHPQPETYFGNVNPVGPRACYDESKRFGEMVVATAVKQHRLDGRIVRIFNTYGPRMRPDDGRAMPSFITAALKNEPLTIHGDGEQTRSFCYVDDLVEYLLRAMAAPNINGEVINIGNPHEITIKNLARTIIDLIGSQSTLTHQAARPEDPSRRQPDISKAKELLQFQPQVSLESGLHKTIDFFHNA